MARDPSFLPSRVGHFCCPLFCALSVLFRRFQSIMNVRSSFSILLIISAAIYKRSLLTENWKYLSALIFLLFSQIALGVLSLKTNLNEPIFIIGHQLNSSLFIAILTTLILKIFSELIRL